MGTDLYASIIIASNVTDKMICSPTHGICPAFRRYADKLVVPVDRLYDSMCDPISGKIGFVEVPEINVPGMNYKKRVGINFQQTSSYPDDMESKHCAIDMVRLELMKEMLRVALISMEFYHAKIKVYLSLVAW